MRGNDIIFDLDGTLIDSVPDVCRALNVTLCASGRRAHSIDEVKGYLGFGAPILMQRAIDTTGGIEPGDNIEDMIKAFLDEYAAYPVVETTVFPHVFDTLASLIDKGARLSICTNKPSITAAPVLEELKLTQYFDAIICGDQVENKKPHGDHILDTIHAVNGNSARAIMVGDSENDIASALDANVPSIAVTFGYALTPHDELGADALIDSFEELPGVVDSIFEARR